MKTTECQRVPKAVLGNDMFSVKDIVEGTYQAMPEDFTEAQFDQKEATIEAMGIVSIELDEEGERDLHDFFIHYRIPYDAYYFKDGWLWLAKTG